MTRHVCPTCGLDDALIEFLDDNSASSFLGGCLGRLAREGAISTRRHRTTTGYWSYLPEVTHAAGVPAPPDDHFLSWHNYAVDNGLDPNNWVL